MEKSQFLDKALFFWWPTSQCSGSSDLQDGHKPLGPCAQFSSDNHAKFYAQTCAHLEKYMYLSVKTICRY